MRKKISILLSALLLLLCVLCTGCGGASDTASDEAYDLDQSESDEGNVSVVTTIFPIYDWTRKILENEEETDIFLLMDKGTDLHSFQPTADDIVKISECDVFIYVGGESDAWVDDVLSSSTNPDMIKINLMDEISDRLKAEESVEGMQSDEEGEAEEEEYDEHIWLSLRNAEACCDVIYKALAELKPEKEALYSENLKRYEAELKSLDEEYTEEIKECPNDTVIVADRFPFRYLADDYGLSYYAAFSGCSAESEASFETIAFLAGKMDELKLDKIIILENSDERLADTVISSTKAQNGFIIPIDSMQSVTAKDVEGGADYLEIMDDNLEALEDALS